MASNVADFFISTPTLELSLCGDLAHAIRGRTDIYLRHKSSGSFVTFSQNLFELSDAVSSDQIYRTTAKSPAGHARAVNSFDRPREINHYVQFTAAHLVVVAQAAMRVVHQVTERVQIAAFKRLCSTKHPLVFGNHMTATFIKHLIHFVFGMFELIQGHIAQRTHLPILRFKIGHSSLALGASRIVFARAKLVLD